MFRQSVSLVCLSVAFVLLLLTPSARAEDYDANLVPIGASAPNFSALSFTGGRTSLSDYRGKIVVLDFWATWCGPCNISMPHLQDIYDLYKDDNVVVLALCVWDSGEDANSWIKAHPQYKFTYALDPASDRNGVNSLSRPFGVKAIPTTYIIDENGIVAARGTSLSEDRIIAALKALGAKTPDEQAKADALAQEIKDADAQNAADEATPPTHTKPIKHKPAKKKKS